MFRLLKTKFKFKTIIPYNSNLKEIIGSRFPHNHCSNTTKVRDKQPNHLTNKIVHNYSTKGLDIRTRTHA